MELYCIFGKGRSRTDDTSQRRREPDKRVDNLILEENDSKQLAKKSGFVSLHERMQSLADQARDSRGGKAGSRRDVPVESGGQGRPQQFATLHELFSSNSLLPSDSHNPYCSCRNCHRQKKPKIPIMKLTKQDWNVKCWEDRLASHKTGTSEGGRTAKGEVVSDSSQLIGRKMMANRARQPERQVEVFQGRIEEVATKLEKVREGTPLDEKLYELALNKRGNRTKSSSHEWTDLLKNELEKGTHDPKLIRSKFAAIGNSGGGGTVLQRRESDLPYKSPLGRPIRRIVQDDESDNQDDEDKETGTGTREEE